MGVVIGHSSHFREETRSTILRFVSAFFAPIFFAVIGLAFNFVTNVDLLLVLVALGIASADKLPGCPASAWWSGARPREAGAIAFAMNARGAMEIVFSLLGYEHGVISARMFVALVVTAIVTSVRSGPAMQRLLRLDASEWMEAQAEAELPPRPLLARTAEEEGAGRPCARRSPEPRQE